MDVELFNAIYNSACAMDNQDDPLENWPERIIKEIKSAGYAVVPQSDNVDRGVDFVAEIQRLINSYSVENDSDTPDFILARYIKSCLDAYAIAVRSRDSLLDDGADDARTHISIRAETERGGVAP